MSFFPPPALDVLDAYVDTTYDDAVTFQTKGGASYESVGAWTNVAALTGLPASVTPVSADEVEDAARFEGRQLYRVDLDASADDGVTAEAITDKLRVRVAARTGFPQRFLQCIGPGEDVQRLGRWLRVLAVDTGEAS